MEERQIIKSLKEGDREAFSMLYKQYWEKVYHFCGLYLNNRDVAEDVVQEVFIKVWESREFIREDDNFKGLLFIITRNLIFNHHRKNVNEDFYKMTVLSAMDTSYDLEEEITAYNLGEYIDHLIEELPIKERRRVIFNLNRKEHKAIKRWPSNSIFREDGSREPNQRSLEVLSEKYHVTYLVYLALS